MNTKQLLEAFTQANPAYHSPLLDNLRETQFGRVGSSVYADWTGAAQFPESLVDKHSEILKTTLLGNTHSGHAPSLLATEKVEAGRKAVLDFCNASSDEYDVIFTLNASGAIILLGQNYIFEDGELLLTRDNHNTVNGIREIARKKGAKTVRYSPLNKDLTLDEESLKKMLSSPRSTGNKLFIFPAKSNLSGEIHSQELLSYASERGWDTGLDAAAYLANNRLDLQKVKPDFIPFSLYKICGMPTALGGLVIKKEKYKKLKKNWFAGGGVLFVSTLTDTYIPLRGHEGYEDGTLNFLGIPAIEPGLEFIKSLGNYKPRLTAVSSFVHENLTTPDLWVMGNSIVVYNRKGNDTVTFNFKRADGRIVDAEEFEKFATKIGIYIRAGCFCNPGASERAFGYTPEIFEKLFDLYSDYNDLTKEKLKNYLIGEGMPFGAIRASFGYMNNFSDADKIVNCAAEFLTTL